MDEQSTCTEPELFTNNHLAQRQSYGNDLGYMVSKRLKFRIVDKEYINLGLLIENSYGFDLNHETKFNEQG